jgi:hypothetical protein
MTEEEKQRVAHEALAELPESSDEAPEPTKAEDVMQKEKV